MSVNDIVDSGMSFPRIATVDPLSDFMTSS